MHDVAAGEPYTLNMSDLSEFLRSRGVPDEAITLLEEQKVSKRELYVGLVLGVCKDYGNATDIKCTHELASNFSMF